MTDTYLVVQVVNSLLLGVLTCTFAVKEVKTLGLEQLVSLCADERKASAGVLATGARCNLPAPAKPARSSLAKAWLAGLPFWASCFSYSRMAAKAAAPPTSSWDHLLLVVGRLGLAIIHGYRRGSYVLVGLAVVDLVVVVRAEETHCW